MNNTYLYIFVIISSGYSLLPAQHKQNINAALKTAQMLERRGDADGALAIYSDPVSYTQLTLPTTPYV